MDRTGLGSLLGSAALRGQEDIPAALQTALSVVHVYSNAFEDQCMRITPLSSHKLRKKIIFRSLLHIHAHLKVTPLRNDNR